MFDIVPVITKTKPTLLVERILLPSFTPVPRRPFLGSSRFAGIVFLSQEGGMGVARLKDSPASEARMIAECVD